MKPLLNKIGSLFTINFSKDEDSTPIKPRVKKTTNTLALQDPSPIEQRQTSVITKSNENDEVELITMAPELYPAISPALLEINPDFFNLPPEQQVPILSKCLYNVLPQAFSYLGYITHPTTTQDEELAIEVKILLSKISNSLEGQNIKLENTINKMIQNLNSVQINEKLDVNEILDKDIDEN